MSENYSDILYRVLEETLENLAFMFAEEVDANEISTADTEWVEGTMNFSGDLHNGTLTMIVPNNISNELAGNILGIDDFSEEAAKLGQDSLKEVLNVICGRVLTEIYGEEPLFELSIPELKTIKGYKETKDQEQENICYALVDDIYPVIMKFEQK
jgi:hypothetical protein